MLQGLPGGTHWKSALKASEQAIYGENLTGDPKLHNCHFCVLGDAAACVDCRWWFCPPGRRLAGKARPDPSPGHVSLAPSTDEGNIPQLVKSVSGSVCTG